MLGILEESRTDSTSAQGRPRGSGEAIKLVAADVNRLTILPRGLEPTHVGCYEDCVVQAGLLSFCLMILPSSLKRERIEAKSWGQNHPGIPGNDLSGLFMILPTRILNNMGLRRTRW